MTTSPSAFSVRDYSASDMAVLLENSTETGIGTCYTVATKEGALAMLNRIADALNRAAQDSANGLYAAIVERLEPHYLGNTRELEWDVPPSTIATLATNYGVVLFDRNSLATDLAIARAGVEKFGKEAEASRAKLEQAANTLRHFEQSARIDPAVAAAILNALAP